MADDEQIEAANRFARERAGGKVEPNPPNAPNFEVKEGGKSKAKNKPRFDFVELPGRGRPVSIFAADLAGLLKNQGVFRRESVPVTINPETAQMEALIEQRFRTFVEKHVVTHTWKADEDEGRVRVPQTMTVDSARAVLQSDQFVFRQKRLNKVNKFPMPVRRKDGKIELLEEGYDAESGIYTMPSKVTVQELELNAAVGILRGLMAEFPFGDALPDTPENRAAGTVGQSRSKAVAITAMVSLFGQMLQRLNGKRLNFVYTANSQRSGKSLLAQCAIIPSCGMSEVQTIPDSKEELRKVLETEALAAAPYIFFDDLEGNLKNNTLNAFMTATIWTGRLMNSQRKFSAPKVSTVFLTGNNLTLSTDIAGRSLLCDLYVSDADPQSRKISRVIDEEYLDRAEVRSELLSAMWTLILDWDRKGRPSPPNVMRGYEEWSRIFGGIVLNAGFGNPLEKPRTDHSGDTEMTDMMDMVAELVSDMDSRGKTEAEYEFVDLTNCCIDNNFFQWLMDHKEKRVDGEIVYEVANRTRSILGKLWTAKYGGRTFVMLDGRRVQFGSRGKNRQRRYLLKIVE